MSLNWMRHFELQLLDQNGQGVSLSDFKVTFQIEWADTRWPRVALVIFIARKQCKGRRISEVGP
ncbi:TPA: hypothetical protein ACHXMU_002296 [Shigella flexneri]